MSSELDLEVRDGDITISLPGSSYSVTYYKPKKSPQLLAKRRSWVTAQQSARSYEPFRVPCGGPGGLPTTRRASSAGSFRAGQRAMLAFSTLGRDPMSTSQVRGFHRLAILIAAIPLLVGGSIALVTGFNQAGDATATTKKCFVRMSI